MGSPRIHPPTQSELEEPRFHLGQRMLITGVKGRFTGPDLGKHSALWQSLAVHLGKIPGQVASITYGVCYNIIPSPFSFEYMAGVEIFEASALLADFIVVRVPEMRYAIFTHRGHVSTLSKTIDTIHQNWLPNSGLQLVQGIPDAPQLLERYDERFDPGTGTGEMELWIPMAIRK